MKKQNTAKKAVLPALLAVLCSTAALTSVSYAWFTLGNTAEVGDIEVNVQAADGMQVSVDAISWKSFIPVADLQNVDTNLFASELAPVSTNGKMTNGVHTFYNGEYDKDGTTVLASLAPTAKGENEYIQFDLYVKLDKAKQFQLNTGSKVTSDGESHFASRVSFADLGVKDNPTEALALTEASEIKIWEPNADQHTDAACYAGAQDGEKYSTQGVNGVDTDGVATTAVVTTYQTTVAAGVATAETLLNLEAGINKVRVTIWLEGQDVDCLNDIASTKLTAALKFVAIDVPAANPEEEQG